MPMSFKLHNASFDAFFKRVSAKIWDDDVKVISYLSQAVVIVNHD